MNRTSRYPLAAFVLLLLSAPVSGQTTTVDSTLRTVEALYYAGSYVTAEVEARRLLEVNSVSDSIRVRAEQWIAFALVAQGKTDLAREHFRNILRIDRNHELDPVLVSPKILVVFNEVKSSFAVPHSASRDTLPVVPVQAFRNVSVRAILFPGWEQLATGRTTTGTIFLSAGAATLGAGIVLEFLRSSARSDYLAATVPSDIASKYDRYNSLRKAEAAAFIAFGLVYIASEIDVLTYDGPVTVGVSTGPNGGRVTVGVALR